MTMNKPTLEQLERGYSECTDCTEAIHLHQSGYDVETHLCSLCKCHVADKTDFFNVPAEIMSK